MTGAAPLPDRLLTSAKGVVRQQPEAAGHSRRQGDARNDDFPKLLSKLDGSAADGEAKVVEPDAPSLEGALNIRRLPPSWLYASQSVQAMTEQTQGSQTAQGNEMTPGDKAAVAPDLSRQLVTVHIPATAVRPDAKKAGSIKPAAEGSEADGEPRVVTSDTSGLETSQSDTSTEQANATPQPTSASPALNAIAAQAGVMQAGAQISPGKDGAPSRKPDGGTQGAERAAKERTSSPAGPDALTDVEAKTEAGPKSAGRKEEALPAPVEARPLASGNSAGKDTSALPDIEVKVVRSETHLAPVSQPPAALQIADRIAQALASPGGADATAGPSPTGADKPAPTSTLKVLHIELQPADLGTVVVRLSLRNDALEIQLDVARANTAHLLQKDRDTLSGLLRSSGYQVDGLAVQVADSDRLSSMSGQQSGTSGSGSGQSSSQYQSGGAQPSGAQANGGGWSGSRSQSENPAQDQSAHRRQGARDADSAGDAGSRGVYV